MEDVGGRLSVILAGHPKLRNDLRRPTMEEIGYRTDVFDLDGIAGSQRDYIHWLLGVSTGNKAEPGDILTPEAVDMLATKLRTPLQVQLHLTLAPPAVLLLGGPQGNAAGDGLAQVVRRLPARLHRSENRLRIGAARARRFHQAPGACRPASAAAIQQYLPGIVGNRLAQGRDCAIGYGSTRRYRNVGERHAIAFRGGLHLRRAWLLRSFAIGPQGNDGRESACFQLGQLVWRNLPGNGKAFGQLANFSGERCLLAGMRCC